MYHTYDRTTFTVTEALADWGNDWVVLDGQGEERGVFGNRIQAAAFAATLTVQALDWEREEAEEQRRLEEQARREPTAEDRKAADAIMTHLNRGGSPLKVARALANNHPTLQQYFMRTCVAFMREMAEKGYVDARNEDSRNAARVALAAWDKENPGGPYLPLI